MNPKYLWLADVMQLLTFFVVAPATAVAIAYAAWRGKPKNFTFQRYAVICVASGVTALALLVLAKRMDADIRTLQYFLQLACVLLGFLLLGVGIGSFFPVLLHAWRWHMETRLTNHNRTEHQ
ncbi:MAG TPA: hypothetical protein VLV49_18625 [Terriglobales bacterium]|nr:hypothetical protein [Terriglobales bacterium]